MKTKIDSSGRLVIPKKVRRDLGISEETPLEFRVVGGCRIQIEPALPEVKIKRKRGRLVVAGNPSAAGAEAISAAARRAGL